MKKIFRPLLIIVAILFVGTSVYAAVKILGSANHGLVVDWKFDENIGTAGLTDSSANGNTIALFGNSAPSWVSGRWGSAVSYDGISQYSESDNHIASLGTIDQPYTISTWVKIAPGETDGNIIHIANGYNGYGWCIPFLAVIDGKFSAISYNSGAVYATQDNVASTDQWHHVVETWSPSHGLRLYVDGVLQKATGQSNFTAAGDGVYVNLARGSGGCVADTGFFEGSIDETKIYNKELSEAQIRNLYSSNTDSIAVIRSATIDDLVLWYKFDSEEDVTYEYVFDKSGNDILGNFVGDLVSIPGKIGRAISLSGSYNYIQIPNTLNNYINPGDEITVSAWLKPNGGAFTQDAAAIVTEGYNGDGTVAFTIMTNIDGNNNKISAGFFDGSWHYVTDPDNFPFNTGWVHLAATYDGSTVKLYVNNILKAQQTYNLPLPDGGEDWYIGKRWDVDDFIDGGIDDVRIYSKALSPDKIEGIYKSGQLTVVNDSRNLRINDTSLVGLFSFDGPDVNWTDNNNAILYNRGSSEENTSLYGKRTATPTPGVVGQGLNFVASESTCAHTSVDLFSNPTAFTVAGWIYPYDYSHNSFFGQNNTIEFGFDGNGNITGWNQSTGNILFADTATPLNKWSHVAFTGDTSKQVLYVNGVSVSQVDIPVDYYITDSPDTFSIGCNVWGGSGDYFNGKIDEVRAYTRALSAYEIKKLYLMGT